MDKKIEELEQRIKELEERLNQSSNMFGRSYSYSGNSDSDYLIKTKGQVKIQWGNKFIDLIKDGKINADSKVIFTADSRADISQKDGIYVTPEGVYIKIGDMIIPIVDNTGENTVYVSFMSPQQTSSEQKHTALCNIGFLYPDLESLTETSLQNGIVYIENTQTLYVIKDGIYYKYSCDIPNPYTKQFVIAKNDNTVGSLFIKGSGKNNSLAFDSLYIYTDMNLSYIESDNSIYVKVSGVDAIRVSNSGTQFITPVISNMIQSENANEQNGFRLYYLNGESTLEVDNLIVRNADENTFILPEFFLLNSNIINNITLDDTTATIELKHENLFKVGDIVVFYYIEGEQSYSEDGDSENDAEDEENEEGEEGEEGQEGQEDQKVVYRTIDGEVVSSMEQVIVVKCLEQFEGEINARFISLKSSLNRNLEPIRISNNNIDIVNYSYEKNEENTTELKKSKIVTRIGDITDCYNLPEEEQDEEFKDYTLIYKFTSDQIVEGDNSNNKKNWKFSNSDTAKVTIVPGMNGSPALRFQGIATESMYSLGSPSINVIAGKEYIVSLYVKVVTPSPHSILPGLWFNSAQPYVVWPISGDAYYNQFVKFNARFTSSTSGETHFGFRFDGFADNIGKPYEVLFSNIRVYLNGKAEDVDDPVTQFHEYGIYSDLAIFDKVQTIKELPDYDNSLNIPNTAWVNQRLLSLEIPRNVIVQFYGDEIPEGWSICDGTNGTPNLSAPTTMPGGVPIKYIAKIV